MSTTTMAAVGSAGYLGITGVSPPAAAVWSFVDSKDGTGGVATLDSFDVGTSNELWVVRTDALVFASQGSSWDVNDKMTLTLAVGTYFGYVVSTGPGGDTVSEPTLKFTVTSGSAAADDNIETAVEVMQHSIVYWPPEDDADENGNPVLGDPIQIDGRWTEALVGFIDSDGSTVLSQAQLIVDRDLKQSGVVMLGVLADITDFDNPKENKGAWEILKWLKTADFDGVLYLREVMV